MSENHEKVTKKMSKDVFGATSSSLETLEENYSYYKDILGSFDIGKTKIELRKRNMLRILDEDWIIAMEDYLPAIDAIIRNPNGSLDDYEEIKPIELTRKVTSRSVIHLAQHTDYINEIKKDGTVMPARLLNVYQDDTMLNYENKFLNTLILRVYSFVMLRYDAISDCAEDGKDISFSYDQEFEEGNRKGHISVKIDVTDPVEQAEIEKNYSTVGDLWRRVNRIVDMSKSLMSSKFVKLMGKNYVKPPIMKTNKLLKNVNFNQALTLWEFIDNYENVGYHTIVDERLETCEDSFLRNFYNSVVAQYVLFNKTVDPEFAPENELAAMDQIEIDPKFKDEFDNDVERELDITDLIPNKEPEQKIEQTGHEDEIDFAIEVALAADDLLFKDVPEETRPYRFSYSFLGRLILAQDPAQDYYTRIKNKLLSYNTVSSNISWKHELFKSGKRKVTKLTMRGKTLCVYLPLNPSDYVDSKYIFEDLTDSKANKDTPFMMKITSERKCKWALELIEVVMRELGLEVNPDYVYKDYHRAYMTPMELCMLKNPLARLLYGDLPEREDDSINYKYDYSFLSRLILAQNPTQDYYNELKNHVMSYNDITDSIHWKYESFINKRKTLVKFKMRGKTLCVYLPLNQEEYTDVAVTYGNSTDKKLPMMIKVKSDRTMLHTKELIDIVMANSLLTVNEKHQTVDYHLEYHTVEEMLAMDPQLVRLIGEKGASSFDEFGEAEAKDTGFERKYNYSFLSRLILAQAPAQDYYNGLKNHIMSYDDITDSITWKHEIFTNKRRTLVKFKMRGKTLCVYLPLDPNNYSDVAVTYGNSTDEKLPMMIKVKSDRTYRHTLELIDIVMNEEGLLVNPNASSIDYHLEYKTVEEMLNSDPQLVKLIGDKTSGKFDEFGEAEEVEEIQNPETEEIAAQEKNGFEYKYNYSFLSRLILAQAPAQDYYNDLKNHIMSYDDVTDSITWKHEIFTNKRRTLVKFKMRGKTLCVYLPLNPLDYSDVAVTYGNSTDSKLPMMIKVKSDRTYRHTVELIDIVMNNAQLVFNRKAPTVDYHLEYKTVAEMLVNTPQLVKLAGDKASGKFNEFGEEIEKGIEYKYNYSFLSRLILAQTPAQDYYNELKNLVMSYDDVTDSITWKHEIFTNKRRTLVKFKMRGKTLCVYLPLDPNNYSDVAVTYGNSNDSKLPMMIKVKSARTLRHTLELIEIVMNEAGLTINPNASTVDYHLEYKTVEQMLKSDPQLVKLNGDKASGKFAEFGEVEAKPVVEEENDDEDEELLVETPKGFERLYDYSFLGRLTLAQNPAQDYYEEIKNHILGYKDVKDNLIWRHETFKIGNKVIALLKVKGKTLNVYLPLDYETYKELPITCKVSPSSMKTTPLDVMIKSNRTLTHTIELIDIVMANYGIEKLNKKPNLNYHLEYHTVKEMLVMNPPLVKLAKSKGQKVLFDASEYGYKEEAGWEYKYNYSFLGRLTLAKNPAQDYYTAIKNRLLCYKDVKDSISWSNERFTFKRDTLALLKARGKTLCIYLPLDPANYSDVAVKFNESRNEKLPMFIKLKSDRALRHTLELIDEVMKQNGIEYARNHDYDYHLEPHTIAEMLVMNPPLVKEANHKYNAISFDDLTLGKKNPFDLSSRNSYSFEARFILAGEPCQTYYETLKNTILSYNKVKCNQSWHHEIFKVGRNTFAKFVVKGKTLNIYINLNPEEFTGPTTLLIDNRIKHPTSNFASLVKVSSNRKVKELIDLFENMLDNMGLTKGENPNVNYHKNIKSIDKLAKMGLVKLGKK